VTTWWLVCSASTATKHYLTLCRERKTDSCLAPLENATQLAPLEKKWREYTVLTIVSMGHKQDTA
jgi:hypothetical protein